MTHTVPSTAKSNRVGPLADDSLRIVDACNEHRGYNLQPNILFFDEVGEALHHDGDIRHRAGPFTGAHWFTSRRSRRGKREVFTAIPFMYGGESFEAEIPPAHTMRNASHQGRSPTTEVPRTMLYAFSDAGVALASEAAWHFSITYAGVFWTYHYKPARATP